MPIMVKFYTVEEKRPKKDQSIIYMTRGSSFDWGYFEPVSHVVEYQWDELDEDGEYTGTSVIYEDGDGDCIEGYRLALIGPNGMEMEDDDLWIDADEYWEELQGYLK